MKKFEERKGDKLVSTSSGIQKTNKMKKTMHHKNKYLQNPPNFIELAEKYSFFTPFLNTTTSSIDFGNAEAVMSLTKVLLLNDYNIKWDLPLNHLCPPVTNRVNYIHWINDLIEISNSEQQNRENNEIIGVDIGTGASCIYPLLGHSIYNWKFIATDISLESLQYSLQNIKKNEKHFQENIHLKLNLNKDDILRNIIEDNEQEDKEQNTVLDQLEHSWFKELKTINFTMCNPPFFDEDETINRNLEHDCRGNENEMITEGGEIEFVKKMLDDSFYFITHPTKSKLFENCWFTSMLGKKKSIQPIISYLNDRNENTLKHFKKLTVTYHTTEFIQGKTTRWGIAWRFIHKTILAKTESINNQLSTIAVQRVMRQNIFKGFPNATKLFQEIEKALKEKKDIVTISKKDLSMASIKGYLENDVKQQFEINILQIQPKQFCVEVKYKGPGKNDPPTNAFGIMYSHLSKKVFEKGV
ncbi:hypothetical protein ABK040_009249 [Willaertia magna]